MLSVVNSDEQLVTERKVLDSLFSEVQSSLNSERGLLTSSLPSTLEALLNRVLEIRSINNYSSLLHEALLLKSPLPLDTKSLVTTLLDGLKLMPQVPFRFENFGLYFFRFYQGDVYVHLFKLDYTKPYKSYVHLGSRGYVGNKYLTPIVKEYFSSLQKDMNVPVQYVWGRSYRNAGAQVAEGPLDQSAFDVSKVYLSTPPLSYCNSYSKDGHLLVARSLYRQDLVPPEILSNFVVPVKPKEDLTLRKISIPQLNDLIFSRKRILLDPIFEYSDYITLDGKTISIKHYKDKDVMERVLDSAIEDYNKGLFSPHTYAGHIVDKFNYKINKKAKTFEENIYEAYSLYFGVKADAWQFKKFTSLQAAAIENPPVRMLIHWKRLGSKILADLISNSKAIKGLKLSVMPGYWANSLHKTGNLSLPTNKTVATSAKNYYKPVSTKPQNFKFKIDYTVNERKPLGTVKLPDVIEGVAYNMPKKVNNQYYYRPTTAVRPSWNVATSAENRSGSDLDARVERTIKDLSYLPPEANLTPDQVRKTMDDFEKRTGITGHQQRLPGLPTEQETMVFAMLPESYTKEECIDEATAFGCDVDEREGLRFIFGYPLITYPNVNLLQKTPYKRNYGTNVQIVNQKMVYSLMTKPTPSFALGLNWSTHKIIETAKQFTVCRGTLQGQLNRYHRSYERAAKQEPYTMPAMPFVLIPTMRLTDFTPEMFYRSMAKYAYHNPYGSNMGPVLNENRDYDTEVIEMLAVRDFLQSLDSADKCTELSTKYCIGKQKLEAYSREKLLTKTRTVFSMNAYAYLPLQFMLSRPAKQLILEDVEDPLNERFLYSVDPVEFVRNLIVRLQAGSLELNRNYWWYFSDNVYGLSSKGVLYSFDGKTMEASVQKSVLQVILEQLEIPGTFIWPLQINDLGIPKDDQFHSVPRWKGKRSALLPTIYSAGAMVRNEDYWENLIADERIEAKYIGDSEVCELRWSTEAPSICWKRYKQAMLDACCDQWAYIGDRFMPVNFMSSGVPYTTFANSILTGNTVLEYQKANKDPKELADKLRGKDDGVQIGRWFATLEAECNLHEITKNIDSPPKETKYFKLDFLGIDALVTPNGECYMILRLDSLIPECLFYKYHTSFNPTEHCFVALYAAVLNGAFLIDNLWASICDVYARYRLKKEATDQMLKQDPENPEFDQPSLYNILIVAFNRLSIVSSKETLAKLLLSIQPNVDLDTQNPIAFAWNQLHSGNFNEFLKDFNAPDRKYKLVSLKAQEYQAMDAFRVLLQSKGILENKN